MKTTAVPLILLFITLFTSSSLVSSSSAPPGFTSNYPKSCCQLDWVYITLGQPLPEAFVPSGGINNTVYGYSYSTGPQFSEGLMPAFKSADRRSEPNWLGNYRYRIYPYPILTNPNKCNLNSYQIQPHDREKPREGMKRDLGPSFVVPTLDKDGLIPFSVYGHLPVYYNFKTGDIKLLTGPQEHITLDAPSGPVDILYVGCSELDKIAENSSFKQSMSMSSSSLIAAAIMLLLLVYCN